jgi:hypothetical protein
MSKRLFVVVFLVLCFMHLPHAEAEEKITLSTYYPAPYGEYELLSVNAEFPTFTINHPTSGETSGIVFNSRVNFGSDKAFILVQDETANSPGSSREDLRMSIGVYNDFRQWTAHSDELWLQGGGRLVYNVGSWDSELNSLIGIPGVGTAFGGVLHEWRVNNSAVMVISNAGNVGIGTPLPTASLQIGASLVSSEENSLLLRGRHLNANKELWFGTGGLMQNDQFIGYSGDLVFGVGNSASMAQNVRILRNGNVGIGITSPVFQLHLSQNSAAKPTSNTWTIFSDERIKKNISDFTDGLNVVMMLQPRNYQYNGLGGPGYDDTDLHIGFIAQEIERICPYMVETGRGLIDGIHVDDFKVYQGHALSFVLVNAIQEQQEQIEALKKRIDFLESYLNIE